MEIKMTLNFIWKNKYIRIARKTQEKSKYWTSGLPDTEIHNKATEINSKYYWSRNRDTDEWTEHRQGVGTDPSTYDK